MESIVKGQAQAQLRMYVKGLEWFALICHDQEFTSHIRLLPACT